MYISLLKRITITTEKAVARNKGWTPIEEAERSERAMWSILLLKVLANTHFAYCSSEK
jgi:hypothetical protein